MSSGTPPDREGPLWLEGLCGKERTKDGPGAGAETPAVPFPQQKVKGRRYAAEHGWHHEG